MRCHYPISSLLKKTVLEVWKINVAQLHSAVNQRNAPYKVRNCIIQSPGLVNVW